MPHSASQSGSSKWHGAAAFARRYGPTALKYAASVLRAELFAWEAHRRITGEGEARLFQQSSAFVSGYDQTPAPGHIELRLAALFFD